MCANPEVMFDVAKEGYIAWFFPLIGAGFLALSLLLLWNERREPQNKRHWRTIFMVAFSALWTIIALFGTLGGCALGRLARAGTIKPSKAWWRTSCLSRTADTQQSALL